MPADLLSDLLIKRAVPAVEATRLYDGEGLYLEVTPKGGRWWRLKCRFAGKEKLLSMGTCPDTSLRKARAKRDEARAQLASGFDPSATRQLAKQATVAATSNAFEVVAREFHETKSSEWSGPHARRWPERLQNDVFPFVGTRRLRT